MQTEASSTKRIFLSAGEASGDAYAAAFIQRVRAARSNVTFEGIGGVRCRAENMTLWADSSSWGAIGIAQSLRTYPRVVASYYRVKAMLRAGAPGLFVPIDFGYANIRLAGHAKRQGWKVLYFVPPGSWRRDRQGRDLPRVTDAIVTPFSWSAEILRGMGANAFWFGHPIKELVAERVGKLGSAGARESLAVLPGSRYHEIEATLPLIANAIEGLDALVEIAVSPSLPVSEVENRWRAVSSQEATFTVGDTAGVLLRAKGALVCSGTATLEAALCRCPMVAFYQLTPAMRREAKLLRVKRPEFFALPNILLNRFAVPELVELDGILPKTLRRELEDVWNDTPARQSQIAAFKELEEMLGPSDAITETANLAASFLP